MTQVDSFAAPDLLAAWKLVAGRISSASPPGYVTVVTFPPTFDVSPNGVRALDIAAEGAGAERPSSVASVLIPLRTYVSKYGPDAAIEAGLQSFGRARRKRVKRFSGWVNTYFERLVGSWYDRGLAKQEIRPAGLRAMIEKMNSWPGSSEAAFYLHTSRDSDQFRRIGSPCLQYVQFRCVRPDRLELVALYRAHDYFEKALGNLIGLQRLGEFVARMTGRNLGSLAIISLHPFTQSSKTALSQYVASV